MAKKHNQLKTLYYCGVTGYGDTKALAKANAIAKLTHIVKHLHPTIITHRGYGVVVYTDSECFSYTIIHPDQSDYNHSSSSGPGDRDQMVRAAIRHLFDLSRAVGEYAMPDWVPTDMRPSLLEWWHESDQYQRAFRKAQRMTKKERGGVEDYVWASQHRTDPEFGAEYRRRVNDLLDAKS